MIVYIARLQCNVCRAQGPEGTLRDGITWSEESGWTEDRSFPKPYHRCPTCSAKRQNELQQRAAAKGGEA